MTFINHHTVSQIDNFNLVLSFVNKAHFYTTHIPFFSKGKYWYKLDCHNLRTTKIIDPCLMYVNPPISQLNS